MEQYLIDTNVVSDFFSESLPLNGMSLLSEVMDQIPQLSIITQIELLSWKSSTLIEQNVKNFINDSIIINISSDVISNCVEIRRKKNVKTPDAIIAGTALAFNLTIITNNEKDFIDIPNLKIINPLKI